MKDRLEKNKLKRQQKEEEKKRKKPNKEDKKAATSLWSSCFRGLVSRKTALNDECDQAEINEQVLSIINPQCAIDLLTEEKNENALFEEREKEEIHKKNNNRYQMKLRITVNLQSVIELLTEEENE